VEAIPVMFWTTATGFAESSTHPAICCLTGCLMCLTGKSVDLVGDWPVQPLPQKYFCFSEMQIRLYSRCPVPQRGGSRSSRTRDRMRWTQVAL
jgi:hypothetical protein